MLLSIDNPDGIERRYWPRNSCRESVRQISHRIYSNEEECFFPYKFYLEPKDVTESPDGEGLATEGKGQTMFSLFPQKAGKRRALEHQESNTATAQTGDPVPPRISTADR